MSINVLLQGSEQKRKEVIERNKPNYKIDESKTSFWSEKGVSEELINL